MPNDQSKLNRFLDAISQLESSKNKNVNHPVIESGIHEGDAALGQFALMPNTVREILNRAKLQKQMTPEMRQVYQAPDDELVNYLKTKPEFERLMAERLGNQLLNKTQGDEEKAAYGWRMGHNLTPEEMEARNYQEHPYVQAYRNILSKIAQPK